MYLGAAVTSLQLVATLLLIKIATPPKGLPFKQLFDIALSNAD